MTTIKSYTDIEQSKKLAEILPIESADNVIVSIGYNDGVKTVIMPKETLDNIKTPFSDIRKITPCWSLSALLKVIGNNFKYSLDYNGISFTLTVGDFEVSNKIIVDACYCMILKLHEQKLL